MPKPLNRVTKKAIDALKKQTIQDALATSDKFVERALVALLARQTADEQVIKETTEENGVGFTGTDGFILTSFAEWVNKSWKPEGQKLSAKQMEIARKKLPKYWRQLAEIAAEKGKEIKPKF